MTAQPLTIVIVGGVAGGASAATRARRMNENATIILLEKDEHVSFANCGLPYYIGEEIPERSKLLVASAELLRTRFLIDVRTGHEAQKIDREKRTVAICNRETGETYEQPYDKLILSPGASPFVPNIIGGDAANVFTLRNLADADRIKEIVDRSSKRKAVVVGAGFIGLEMVEQLLARGFEVSLAELLPQVLPPLDPEMANPLEQELTERGVRLALGNGIQEITTDSRSRATGVVLQNGERMEGDFVILGLGVRPNVQLARDAGLSIGSDGGILTNRFQQTNDPAIYAVGDAADYVYGPTGASRRIPLAGPANRSGRVAGGHAAVGTADEMAPVFGTAIVRFFSQTAAVTGLSMKVARQLGVNARSVTVIAGHHAGYFPGARPLTIKLIYDPESGQILGAQSVGSEGVDKRIDVIATAMAMKGTVTDLAGLDLSYAPPYGSAKDPIHLAAFAACNQMQGIEQFEEADADLTGRQVVDVRTESEVSRSPLAGAEHAINIPVDELRARLDELDPALETVVTCAVGVRGHVAARILRQNGFADVANLSGGATMRNRAIRGEVKQR